MGKLFVIEGTDGSGKSTQFKMVCDNLEKLGVPFRKIVFPRYTEQSSALIRMYLGGEFGTSPDAVNAYAASTFFAVDRYASFKTDWEKDYLAGMPIICDRYTTSNAVHQAAKLPEDKVDGFLKWLFEYEYDLLGIPAPSKVFFLDIPSEMTFDLLKKRQGDSGDIHERDHKYLEHCRASALDICEKHGWIKINCVKDGKRRTIEDIHEEIYKLVKAKLGE